MFYFNVNVRKLVESVFIFYNTNYIVTNPNKSKF